MITIEPTTAIAEIAFVIDISGGVRYYSGRWDGERITGTLSRDAAGNDKAGTFELRR